MFEHAHGNHAIPTSAAGAVFFAEFRASGQIPVIQQQIFHRQFARIFPRHGKLPVRHGDARHPDLVMLRHIPRQATPSATDVQYAHARFQLELAADHLHLGKLGVLKIVRLPPVTATVLHIGVKHGLKQRGIGIIVMLCRHKGTGTGLEIQKAKRRFMQPA